MAGQTIERLRQQVEWREREGEGGVCEGRVSLEEWVRQVKAREA